MSLKDQLNADFATAYKERDMVKKNFLSVVKGAVQTQEGKGIESTDENVLKVIKQFDKTLKESIEARIKLNQDAAELTNELTYLEPYLPKVMSEDEITELVKALIESTDNKNVGFLMGQFNKQNSQLVKSFDNKLVSQVIAKLVV